MFKVLVSLFLTVATAEGVALATQKGTGTGQDGCTVMCVSSEYSYACGSNPDGSEFFCRGINVSCWKECPPEPGCSGPFGLNC